MRVHVEALFSRDSEGLLLKVNEPDGADAPRFLLGRTDASPICVVRHDVPDELAAALGALSEREPSGFDAGPVPDRHQPYLELLSTDQPVERMWAGPAYHFVEPLATPEGTVAVTSENVSILTPFLEPWRPDVAAGVPCAASLHGGRAVSICCSVRVTGEAHEAGVETHPEYRGQGHGSRAATAWAAMVAARSRIPLYSTSWDNEASRRLARRLGLEQFGSDFHAT
jgi:GNAT superfamily N-acetyltransferase